VNDDDDGAAQKQQTPASVDGVLFTALYKTASPQNAETSGLLQEIDDAWLAAHFVEHSTREAKEHAAAACRLLRGSAEELAARRVSEVVAAAATSDINAREELGQEGARLARRGRTSARDARCTRPARKGSEYG
jgi:hypothetical protein